MKEDKHATENFQILNYGMGGRIEAHLDTLGKSNDPTSAEKNIFLEDPESPLLCCI